MLSLDDVTKMIPPPPYQLDPTTKELIIQQKRVIFERRISHVYENLTLFNKIWPNGQPIDLFIALMLSNDCKQLAFHKLFNPNFLLQIVWQAESFGYHIFSSNQEKEEYIQTNPYFYENLTESELEILDPKNIESETSDYDSEDGSINYSFSYEQIRQASLNRANSVAKNNVTNNYPKERIVKPISQPQYQPNYLISFSINEKDSLYTAGNNPS